MSLFPIRTLGLALAITAPFSFNALALAGVDGNDNPIPGVVQAITVPPGLARVARAPSHAHVMAGIHHSVGNQAEPYDMGATQAREPHAGDPNAVYVRGKYWGTDPDPNVRLEMRRDAIGGGD
jgi:hypothetical protein